ncbi:MAG: UDP-N-acetylmuramate--L-alanine ligase [Oscillospiraceae bacterium]|nr:UDP-N-acetylmuramate--L-alanine ligase [Oscillospiraceae bacterium]
MGVSAKNIQQVGKIFKNLKGNVITLDKNVLLNKKHIHFIGIGGSGMYPLAQILHSKGYYLTGSDNNETATLQAVRDMGIPVFLGQRAENIEGADLIVYSAAIMSDNPELVAAKNSDAVVLERSDLLGLVTSWYDNAVCVCGTHGKTTASSMLTTVFMEEGIDISCVIGGKLKSIGGSGRAGKSDTMICEACEYVDTFLRLYPDIAVILNVDADHLEYFKNLDNIKKSFNKFASMATKCLVVNGDDKNTLDAIEGLDKEVITFGFDRKNDFSGEIVSVNGMKTEFNLYIKGEFERKLTIFVPGVHNVLNALATVATAVRCGVSLDGIEMGLQVFRGAVRRFERIDEVKGITIVDDYAHHPKELEVTLSAAKKLGYKRVWAVFQPFTYSRTSILLDDFVKALEIADKVVLTDIMGSREKNTLKIYTEDLGKKIDGAVWFDYDKDVVDEQTAQQKSKNFTDIVEYLKKNLDEGDLVITLGCGDVYKLAVQLAGELKV